MAGDGVTDFVDDFGDRYELVGASSELLSALYNGGGIDDGYADAFAGFAAADREIRGNQGLLLLVGFWGWLRLDYVAPTGSLRWRFLHGLDIGTLR